MKILINADDFGWSASSTEAILQCFEKGYIASTTMCANGAAFEKAVQSVQKTAYRDQVGIHFVLTEGRPLTEAIRSNHRFCDEQGLFHGQINRYKPLDQVSRQQVQEELTAQAQRYADSGLTFHHADSHHHIHTGFFITPIVRQVMERFGIQKLRIHRNIGPIPTGKWLLKQALNSTQRACAYSDWFGSFEDVAYSPEALRGNGVLEIMCHPDLDSEGMLIDRQGGDYDNPSGTAMEEQFLLLGKKTDYDE